MRVKLKQLTEQTIVITGATSGIGLVTARRAAERGAKLVLAARNDDALQELSREIQAKGGHAVGIAVDVGEESDIRRLAKLADQRFGGFDTWVNNAGVTIYGRLTDISVHDMRRLFETNFWGVVYGSRVAAEHLRQKGGALINVGSTLSDRAIPLQGIYAASKHAVKGFTDALRMELEEQSAPVSVTLIKPAAIDTPYRLHGRNYLPAEPLNPAPVYAPEVVADAILHCAETPERDVFVGAGGKFLSALGESAPRLTDKYMEAALFDQQQGTAPARDSRGTLYTPGSSLRERGGHNGHVSESSVYTKASFHPAWTGAAAFGVGWALSALLRSKSGKNSPAR